MIKKSALLPEWLDKLAEKLFSNKGKKEINKNACLFIDAEKLGFFDKSKYIGRNLYEVTASSGFFDEGSVWYLDTNENGDKILTKQVDEAGNIIRRFNNLKKEASKNIEIEKFKEIEVYLKNINSNLDNYNLYDIKEKINNLEDNILSSDPIFSKEASYKLINHINITRDLIDHKIANSIKEYDEYKEVIDSIAFLKKNYKFAMSKDQYEEYLQKIEKELDETGYGIKDKKRREELLKKVQELKDELGKKLEIQEPEFKSKALTSNAKNERLNKKSEIDNGYSTPEEAQNALQNMKDKKMQIVKKEGDTKWEIEPSEKMAFINNVRIHKGKFIRKLEKNAESNTNIIKCFTPECIHNNSDQNICNLRFITIKDHYCTNYEKERMNFNELNKLSNKIALKDEKSEMDKDIPIEKIETVDEDDINKNDNENINDEQKKIIDIKSKVWETATNEAIDKFLDIKDAKNYSYKKMLSLLQEEVENKNITQEEMDNLLNELEELKDDNVIEEYLQNRLNDEILKSDSDKLEKKEEEEIELPKAASKK